MGCDSGKGEQIIEGKIAVADCVETIRGDSREAEFARNGVAVDAETVTCQRTRTHGTRVGGFRRALQASEIARTRLSVREQKMREENLLRMLHVRHAGHGRAKICFRLFEKSTEQLEDGGFRAS